VVFAERQRSDNGAGTVAEGGGVIAVVCTDLLGSVFDRFIFTDFDTRSLFLLFRIDSNNYAEEQNREAKS